MCNFFCRLDNKMVQYRHCPPTVKIVQDAAITAQLLLVSQVGPTAWMVGHRSSTYLQRPEGDSLANSSNRPVDKPFRVAIGKVHSCTCTTFRATKELCIHLCWLLLKKFNLPSTNPLSFQVKFGKFSLKIAGSSRTVLITYECTHYHASQVGT